MNIVIIVQASTDMGLGHLLRTIAIAQQVHTKHGRVLFVTDDVTAQLASERDGWLGEIEILKEGFSDTKLAHNIVLAVRKKWPQISVNCFIVDGYQFSSQFCQTLRDHGAFVALMEDGVYSPPYGANVIVNSACSDASVYQLEKGETRQYPLQKGLFGPAYRLVRKEFADIKPAPVAGRKTLTICFGGSDAAGLSLPVLQQLALLRWPHPVRVVTTSAHANIKTITKAINALPLVLEHCHNVQNMAQIWTSSRLAVSAAGGSLFELALCETPSILVMVADNQREAINAAVQEGWCRSVVAGKNADETAKEIVALLHALWLDSPALTNMQQSLIGKYDAMGAERILSALETQYCADKHA